MKGSKDIFLEIREREAQADRNPAKLRQEFIDSMILHGRIRPIEKGAKK